MLELILPINIAGSLNRPNKINKIESLTIINWTNGTFQDSFQTYINDNIGLFSLFIKLHNQLEYTLFNNVYTGNVISGKENYLFEEAYINNYLGKDFMGLENIKQNTLALKELQDSLAVMGKTFVFCLAPGKPSYYPEYVPVSERLDSTNTYFYEKEFEALDINNINCIRWFNHMKDSLGHYLYPKYGVHWSHYGAMLVSDSLVKYHEQKFDWDLPNMRFISTNESPKTKFFDNDIANSMNLFKTVEPFPYMIYPEIEWEDKTKFHDKKKALIIGDSYTWDIYLNSGINSNSFDEFEFWYYNQLVNAEMSNDGKIQDKLPTLIRHLNLKTELEKFDGFIILSAEPNLNDFGWNVIQDFLGAIKDQNYTAKERNNEFLLLVLQSNDQWQNELLELAKSRNISLDSMTYIYLHDKNYQTQH